VDRKRGIVLRITVAAGLMAAAPLIADADQLFLVQTPSGNATGTCFDTGCTVAGVLGTDTAINAGGRFTNFSELGQTGIIPPGVNIFAHIEAGIEPETVTLVYSIDGLRGGAAWSQVFSALVNPGDTGELQTYLGPTLGAKTTLLATQNLVFDGSVTSSGAFDFGSGPYALTQVLTLNLEPRPDLPDYSRLLEDPKGFFYGTLTTASPEPTTFLLLTTGLLGCLIIASHRPRRRPSWALHSDGERERRSS
jgi:hypothetical protein